MSYFEDQRLDREETFEVLSRALRSELSNTTPDEEIVSDLEDLILLVQIAKVRKIETSANQLNLTKYLRYQS